MADRPYVSQVVQIGPEVLAGVPVAASKRLQSMRLTPGIGSSVVKQTPMGYIYPTVTAKGQLWTEFDAQGAGAYTELQYALSSMFGKATPTQIGTTGAYTWVNQGGIFTIDDAQTYTVEVGDSNFAERAANACFVDWDMTLTRKEVGLKGRMLAKILKTGFSLSAGSPVNEVQTVTINGTPTGGSFTLTFNGQTTAPISETALGAAVATALNLLPDAETNGFAVTGAAGGPYTVTFQNALAGAFFDTLVADGSLLTGGTNPSVTVAMTTPGHGASPSAISVVPILPDEGNIYVDTSYASIGQTKLRRNYMGSMSVTGKSGMMWPIDRDESSFAALIGLEPKSQCKLQLQADAAGLALFGHFQTGQTLYVRYDYLSPSMAGTNIPFRWTLDVCMKVEAPGKFADADGVYVLEYTLQPVADPVSGFAFKSTLINNQSAL